VGPEVRDKCEARSLREATTSARGPFTGVVGFVHANVICGGHKINVRALRRRKTRKPAKLEEKKVRCTFMEVAYERAQVVEGVAAVFPLTGDDIEWRTGVGWLACGRTGTRIGWVVGVREGRGKAVLR
jgi:hypothetical protein